MSAESASKKQRGGYRQREREEALSQDPATHLFTTVSGLARWLLVEYVFGFLSALQLQKCAFLAVQDGINNPELSLLAGVGSNGRYPHNIADQMKTFLKRYLAPIVLPEPEPREIPLKLLKGPREGIHLIKQYFMFPHRWFAFMHRYFPAIYAANIRGSPAILTEFGGSMDPRDPRLASFPILRPSSCTGMASPARRKAASTASRLSLCPGGSVTAVWPRPHARSSLLSQVS